MKGGAACCENAVNNKAGARGTAFFLMECFALTKVYDGTYTSNKEL
jgi:hypothetical protein